MTNSCIYMSQPFINAINVHTFLLYKNTIIRSDHGHRLSPGFPISLYCTLLATKPRSSVGSPADLLHSSCLNASYPQICLRTLSCYTPPATNRFNIAQTAIKVSLSRAQKTSNFLANTKSRINKREQNALDDCVSQISDSIDELSKTMSELKHLQLGTEFKWQMSNAETWVSAALTDEDTCIDGFKESDVKMRGDLKRKIRNVARVASNALYLINLLDHQAHQRSAVRNP